jgi:hypothetical protein
MTTPRPGVYGLLLSCSATNGPVKLGGACKLICVCRGSFVKQRAASSARLSKRKLLAPGTVLEVLIFNHPSPMIRFATGPLTSDLCSCTYAIAASNKDQRPNMPFKLCPRSISRHGENLTPSVPLKKSESALRSLEVPAVVCR